MVNELKLWKGALAAAAIAGAAVAWPASAQDAPAIAGCAAAKCLGVALSPELAAQLAGGTVTVEALAEGLVFSYRGEEPIDVRLVASRYDNGRLVRYGVSARTRLAAAGTGLAVADAAAAVAHAFTPATHRVTEVASFGAASTIPVSLPAYVGNVPPTNLVGEPGLVALSGDTSGSIGVIALEPEDPALRDGMAAGSVGAVVRLNLVRP